MHSTLGSLPPTLESLILPSSSAPPPSGDWGTQFGMLIQHMSERPEGLVGDDEEGVRDLMQLYRASKKRFDEEEDFKQRAREAVTRLQSGQL